MRSAFVALTVVGALALAASVVALAGSRSDGLPAYTEGYAGWQKLNRRPVTTPGAHTGVKNIYASRRRARDGRFPSGTVIVKSVARPGATGPAAQVAVMRKVLGRWRWVEYTRESGRYEVLARGSLCTSCHVQARANDWVFTTR
ncbi:MAG TPA: cytochrome P460 family protein [Gaiella sp.]|jgi:hypothetical protein